MAVVHEDQAHAGPAPVLDYDAIIVGAGISGMFQLYRLTGELQSQISMASKVQDVDLDPDTPVISNPTTTGPVGENFNLPPLEHRACFDAPARSIFQSVEYCLQDSMLDTGPRSIAAPVRIALDTLKLYPQFHREVLWAEQAMKKIGGRSLRILIYS